MQPGVVAGGGGEAPALSCLHPEVSNVEMPAGIVSSQMFLPAAASHACLFALSVRRA